MNVHEWMSTDESSVMSATNVSTTIEVVRCLDYDVVNTMIYRAITTLLYTVFIFADNNIEKTFLP